MESKPWGTSIFTSSAAGEGTSSRDVCWFLAEPGLTWSGLGDRNNPSLIIYSSGSQPGGDLVPIRRHSLMAGALLVATVGEGVLQALSPWVEARDAMKCHTVHKTAATAKKDPA